MSGAAAGVGACVGAVATTAASSGAGGRLRLGVPPALVVGRVRGGVPRRSSRPACPAWPFASLKACSISASVASGYRRRRFPSNSSFGTSPGLGAPGAKTDVAICLYAGRGTPICWPCRYAGQASRATAARRKLGSPHDAARRKLGSPTRWAMDGGAAADGELRNSNITIYRIRRRALYVRPYMYPGLISITSLLNLHRELYGFR
eukprot:SAG31_NODE_3_length_45830_cov_42.279701_25_plen_205_part_00